MNRNIRYRLLVDLSVAVVHLYTCLSGTTLKTLYPYGGIRNETDVVSFSG